MFLLKKVQYVVRFICEENGTWTQIQYSTQSFVHEKLHKSCLIKFMKAPQNWRSFFHCINYSLFFSVSADLLWEISVSLSSLLMKILANMGPSISHREDTSSLISTLWGCQSIQVSTPKSMLQMFQNSASKWECGERWCQKTYQHRAVSQTPVLPHP